MTSPALVAFDLDDTLAPSKGPIDPRISGLLRELLRSVDVAIISGGNEPQFRTQVIAQLADADAAALARLHLLPTCGTRYLRQRIHGVPGALDLIGWSIGTWAHGRAYVAPLDGYTPAARDAAALADRDSLAALPTA